MERNILIANKDMVLTDGETYGKKIYLAEGMNVDKFYEIAQEEYDRLMAESEEMPND